MLKDLLLRWPLIQQILTGADGTGAEAMSERTRNLRPKNQDAEVMRSICPTVESAADNLSITKVAS